MLGIVAVALAALLWRPLGTRGFAGGACAASRGRARCRAPRSSPPFCYAAFGFGYIIPATFLPALAKGYIDNPAMFGLIWPVFGAAAALSTFASARLGRGLAPWQLWTRAKWVLAAGVLAPALWVNIPTLLLSAVCVGGTFMIITMAGIKEALRLGGTPAPLAVGVMTAAFGAGQIAGPLDGEPARPLRSCLRVREHDRGGEPRYRQLRAAVLRRPCGGREGVSRDYSARR